MISSEPKNMIFHFLSLTAAVSAQELGTDCNAVRRFVYPGAAECTGVQFCSDDFACDVAADCGSYTCKSASDCPEGTTYQVFSPIIDDDGQQTMRVNSLNGYYCANDPPFLCSVDSSGNFYVEATVKNKYPWDGIGTPDNRQLSMISKRKFEANDGAIFKQFGNSSCFGEIIDDGNRVRFIKSTDDPNCGKEIEISFFDSPSNGLTYVIDFFIGFDDLTKINEFDREVIVRGGVANEFQCRLKASDNDFVIPDVTSSTINNYVEYDGEITMNLKSYLDKEFSKEGSSADVSEQKDFDRFYLEGKHEIEAGEALESHIFHFRECRASVFKLGEDDSVEPTGNSSVFLTNGCIKDTKDTYFQNISRVEWADETAKTRSKDQFMIVPSVDPDTSIKIKYSCDMNLCPLDVFFTETSMIAPCFLADECKTDLLNRYSNLRNSRNARSPVENNVEAPVKYAKMKLEGDFTITRRSDDVNATTSNALQQAVASVALIVFLLFFK